MGAFPSRDATDAEWHGDATSVIEFLRPLREHLDAPGVLEVCVNRPGEILVETHAGWRTVSSPAINLDRCLALATAIATYCDQNISAERPLLSATLPTGERVQIVIPPAATRGTVSITLRKPSHTIKTLEAYANEGLFARARRVQVAAPHPRGTDDSERRAPDSAAPANDLIALLHHGEHVAFLREAVRRHLTIVVSGRTGSGKTTFIKGLVEEIPRHERLVTIQDAAELTLPNHPNAVHLFYSKDGQGTARVTPKTLLEACLRMRPDRILLAEVRGDECYAFIRLAASGHPGSITSVHAGSCALAFEQMALMIRESGAGGSLGLADIRTLLHSVIDIVVQFDRDAQGRFVSEIHVAPRVAAASTSAPADDRQRTLFEAGT